MFDAASRRQTAEAVSDEQPLQKAMCATLKNTGYILLFGIYLEVQTQKGLI